MNTEQKFTAPAPVTVDESLLTRFRDAANETDRDPFTIIPPFLMRIELAINKLKGMTCPASESTGITVEQHREMICLELALLLLEKQIPGYAFEGLAAYCKFCNEDSNIRYQDGTVKLLLRYPTPSNDPVYPPIWAYANATWGWEACIGNVRPDYQMQVDGQKGRDTLRPYLEKIDAARNTKTGGCFIATACYESPVHPSVLLLKSYRDETLLKSFLGRLSIKFYYLVSPRISNWLSKRNRLKHAVRSHILDKIVVLVSHNTK